MASYWMVGMVTMEATPWAQEENSRAWRSTSVKPSGAV